MAKYHGLNTQGKKISERDEFALFAKDRLRRIIDDLG
jgi:hypothetical protein